jgi:hypothetical protein
LDSISGVIHADDLAVVAHLLCREEAVDAAAAAEVQHHLARLQSGKRERRPAPQPHVCAFRQRGEFVG